MSQPLSVIPIDEPLIDAHDLEKCLQAGLVDRATGSSNSTDNDGDVKYVLTTVQIGTDWNGPDDPDNPLNWPKWKKTFYIVPPALVSFTATVASSIYTPAHHDVMKNFNVGETVALLPLSIYVLALGFGPIIAAPISETFGRHVVYLVTPPLGALFTLGAGLSPSFAGLIISRFFAGLCFSPALAIGAGTIADCHNASDRVVPIVIYTLSPFLGPALGPVIGSFAAVRKGWAWTQYTVIFFAIFSWIFVLFMRETYKPIILHRRHAKLGFPDPPSPFLDAGARIKFLFSVTLIRPIHMLLVEPIVGLLSLYIAFSFGVLFTFFAAFPYVFGTIYHFDTEQSGLVFFAVGIGCGLAVPTALLCDHYLYQKQVRIAHANGENGVVAPEHRLYTAMLGSFGLPIGLFWFGWSARASVLWASPVVAAIPFAWGNLSIFISAGMYLLDTYQALNGASALAANGLLRYMFGAAFPLFALQMYARLGTAWATSLLGFIAIALMPVPFVLFKFGHKIRAHSKYDTIRA